MARSRPTVRPAALALCAAHEALHFIPFVQFILLLLYPCRLIARSPNDVAYGVASIAAFGFGRIALCYYGGKS
jgi:hypothetical protein